MIIEYENKKPILQNIKPAFGFVPRGRSQYLLGRSGAAERNACSSEKTRAWRQLAKVAPSHLFIRNKKIDETVPMFIL